MGRFRVKESEKECVVEIEEREGDVDIRVNDYIVAYFEGKTGILKLIAVDSCGLPLDDDGYLKVEWV